MRPCAPAGTRLRTSLEMPSAARVMAPKLTITPLGCPVEPEVYISIASSSGPRAGCPASGGVRATTVSQLS